MNKEDLRKKYLYFRRNIDVKDKLKYDKEIFDKIIYLKEYLDSSLVLIYVSLKDEVDTIKIIEYSLSIGKKVAVPKCIDEKMEFHIINSLSELKEGYFGILEPINNNLVEDFENSICIVPGVCFDKDGNRVGYGGGYYDKFLKRYKGRKIGIIYKECICDKISIDKYDIKVDKVICNN